MNVKFTKVIALTLGCFIVSSSIAHFNEVQAQQTYGAITEKKGQACGGKTAMWTVGLMWPSSGVACQKYIVEQIAPYFSDANNHYQCRAWGPYWHLCSDVSGSAGLNKINKK